MEIHIIRYGCRNITKQNIVRCSIQKRFSACCNYSQVMQKITCLVTIEKMSGAPRRTVQFWYSAFRTQIQPAYRSTVLVRSDSSLFICLHQRRKTQHK